MQSMPDPPPELFNHQYVSINGIERYHYVEEGPSNGMPLVFMHGFPDLWYGWRKQIYYFSKRGYRVIVPSLRGYCGNEVEDRSPPSPGMPWSEAYIKQFGLRQNSDDVAALMDYLGVKKAVILGHDWGGALAWRFRLYYPHRVLGLVVVCTPYAPPSPDYIPIETVVQKHPNFSYQIYLTKPESAAELNQNVGSFINSAFRRWYENSLIDEPIWEGKFGELATLPPSNLLSREALQFYIDTFSKYGFDGPTNWYRARRINFETEKMIHDPFQKIEQPTLMLTAEHDGALPPKMTENMPHFFSNLKINHVKGCDHWILWEQPEVVNTTILAFLEQHFGEIKSHV